MTMAANDLIRQALAALQAGKAADAERLFRQVLRSDPNNLAALNLFGIVLTRIGRFDEAETHLKRALSIGAPSDATLYNYGIVLKALKRPQDAFDRFSQALALNASVPETWNNRGTVLNELKRFNEAVADFDKAIALKADYADALVNKGKALAELQRLDQALAAFDRALALQPTFAEAWNGRGNVLSERKQYADALAAYDKALALRGNLAGAWLGRGNVLSALRQYGEAFGAYDKALALKPDLAEVWLGRGNACIDQKRFDDAFAAYDKALALKPELAEAWYGRGNAFTELRRYDEAFAAYDRAWQLNPALKHAEGQRLYAKLLICDWTDLEAETARLLAAVWDGKPASLPFILLPLPSTPVEQLQCARQYVADVPTPSALWRGEAYAHERIRVGYVSTDFHEHPVGLLTVGLFEAHDRQRFEITGFSLDTGRDSEVRRRIQSAFDRFVDVSAESNESIARLIRESEIDILVDLNGFTGRHRFNVFAMRPAPVQVTYLGYPSTTGAGFIDYILADATVIPRDQFDVYSEKVVWLPDSFQPNDARRRVSERTPTRAECGLPEDAFVFCCFNNSHKISPDVFRVWTRLLAQVDGSVLWLSDANATATANLRREAERSGIAPERVIFAPKVPDLADHLARHRQADLFLDTWPYNAHTTASDALWAGLPLLTYAGGTYAARVAASLLQAVGLDELIAHSPEDYTAMALKLAHERPLLAVFKDRLVRQRATGPLFDTDRTARHIEAAYATMWQRCRDGQPAEAFAVDPLPRG